jgi:transposase InsO family protein
MVYKALNISKQGLHQYLNRQMKQSEQNGYLAVLIGQIRTDHPTLSCRAMYHKIKPETMGRDAFELLCNQLGFSIERKINGRRTTDSSGVIRFENLVTDLVLSRIDQVWSSDITYYELNGRFYYLTFVLDNYSRRILGHTLSSRMFTQQTTLPALHQAIASRNGAIQAGLIFHSDGGGQYYDKDFIALTKTYAMRNSMCEKAWENGKAERLNGIIKNNYLVHMQATTEQELRKNVDRAVHLYNHERPHKSLAWSSPVEFEKRVVNLQPQTRPTMSNSSDAKTGSKDSFEASSLKTSLQTRPQNRNLFSSKNKGMDAL